MELSVQNYADIACAVGIMRRVGISYIDICQNETTIVLAYSKAKELFPNQQKWIKDDESINEQMKYTHYHVNDAGFKFVFCDLEFIGEEK